MMKKRKQLKTIDEYVAAHPGKVRILLETMRMAIRLSAPEAEETISYQMPAYRLNGILVYFAAFKNHIGFYPTASAIEAFKDELSSFDTSKGTVRFPLGKPIPIALVKRIVKFRVKENQQKTSRARL